MTPLWSLQTTKVVEGASSHFLHLCASESGVIRERELQ